MCWQLLLLLGAHARVLRFSSRVFLGLLLMQPELVLLLYACCFMLMLNHYTYFLCTFFAAVSCHVVILFSLN